MSLLVLQFTPTLALWRPHTTVPQWTHYPTGNNALDEQIRAGMQDDVIELQYAYQTADTWRVYNYDFDTATNTIRLWVNHPGGGNVTVDALRVALPEYDTQNWTARNLAVVDAATAQRFGYERIEVHPQLVQILLLMPNGSGGYQQHVVDLTHL